MGEDNEEQMANGQVCQGTSPCIQLHTGSFWNSLLVVAIERKQWCQILSTKRKNAATIPPAELAWLE